MATTDRTAFLLRQIQTGAPRAKAWAAGALGLALLLPASLQAQEAADDKAYLEKRLSKILEFERTGAEIPWSNPETGNSGNIQLKRTYFLNPNSPCRDYIRSINTGEGEPETVRGTGCREDDGRWKLTEDAKPKRTVERGPAEEKTAAATPGGAGAPAAKAPAGAEGASPRPEGAKAATPAAKPAAAKKAAAAPAKAAPKAPPPPPKISARVPSRAPEWEAASDNAY